MSNNSEPREKLGSERNKRKIECSARHIFSLKPKKCLRAHLSYGAHTLPCRWIWIPIARCRTVGIVGRNVHTPEDYTDALPRTAAPYPLYSSPAPPPGHVPASRTHPPGYALRRLAPPANSRRRALRQAHPPQLRLQGCEMQPMAASSPKSTAAFINSVAELPEITRFWEAWGEEGGEIPLCGERGARAPSARGDHQE